MTESQLSKEPQTVQVAYSESDINPTVFRILLAVSIVHLLNDVMQSVIPAIFPILKNNLYLTYTQIGLIAFTFNLTASLMQPIVGIVTDRKPIPYLLPFAMAFTLIGMLLLAFASSYGLVLLSVCFIGLGSAIFHPEGSRVAFHAAGRRKGLGQSIYQVGGNAGASLGPLMTKIIFIPFGQIGALFFTVIASCGIAIQFYIAHWYKILLTTHAHQRKQTIHQPFPLHRKNQILIAMMVLLFTVFIRTWYDVVISNYFAFFLLDSYDISLSRAQDFIFLFLLAGALGTFLGGPLADRFGRKHVILYSLLLTIPFSILLPYASFAWTYVLLSIIGFITFSSFSVSVVYAHLLFPGRVGTISGMIVGFAFGVGGIGALISGVLCDTFGTITIMKFMGFVPLFGVVGVLLPSDDTIAEWSKES
jgi:FSR family fosmidomycin resistance protein-like MFS transporter